MAEERGRPRPFMPPPGAPALGGLSFGPPAGSSVGLQYDFESQQLVDQFLNLVNASYGKNYTELNVVQYKTQVVAGKNFFIKARSDTDEYVHLKIFVPGSWAQAEPSLSGCQFEHTAYSEIEYF